MRADGRQDGELRRIEIEPGFTTQPAGSVLMRCGRTMVLCTASIERGVPPFRVGKGGWLTAEYCMAPGSTHTRSPRESMKGKVSGRTHEIQRLIGRSLRAAIDINALAEVTIAIDCEVLQADGGTRTTSITGGWVALALAVHRLLQDGAMERSPIGCGIQAVSAGVLGGQVLVDLPYEEDSRADVDANLVRTSNGDWVEIQASGEGGVLSRAQLDAMIDASNTALDRLWDLQRQALGATVCRDLGFA
jgi:ribonuclease PH